MTLAYLYHTGRAWMVLLPNGQHARVWWQQAQNINWRPPVGYYWAHRKWDGSYMIDNPYAATPLPQVQATPAADDVPGRSLLDRALDLFGLQRKAS